MANHLVLKNTTANFLGKLSNRVVRILLVPLQIKMLGDEAFGLLGLYALVGNLLAMLDFGLTMTGRREIARYAARGEQAYQDMRDLIRTFEIPYWGLGILAGGVILLSAGWFTDHWVTAPGLQRQTVVFSISIIGLLFVARWPVSLYTGFLHGLQHQVASNTLAISIEILNGAGSIIVLLIRPDVKAFFIWQLFVGIVEISGYMWLCWRSVRQTDAPSPMFRPAIFSEIWRFAVGVNINMTISALFTRSDGLILSKVLPINYLGYYSLAQRVPSLVGLVSGSILPATTPIMVGHYEKKEHHLLSRIYHRQARWLAFLSVGISFPIAVFAHPILLLWTQSATVADQTWMALSLVSAVSALEIMSNSVNQLSLSCGFTRPALIIVLLEGITVVAGTLLLAPLWGIVGAAFSWTIARTLRFILYPLFINRLVLPGEAKIWFLRDTLPIVVIGLLCFGVGGIGYQTLLDYGTNHSSLIWIPFAFAAGLLYIAIVLAFGFIPEWRTLPILSRISFLPFSGPHH